MITPEPGFPKVMDHHEKLRMRSAAFRATRLYPGPVGELVQRELLSWENFGYRLGAGNAGFIPRLVDAIMTAEPVPAKLGVA